MRYKTFCLLGALVHWTIAVGIIVIWLLTSGCAKKATLPTIYPPIDLISIGKNPPATGPAVGFPVPKTPTIKALAQRAKLGTVHMPQGLSIDCEGLRKFRACGFEQIEFIPKDAVLYQCAADIGLHIALTYQGEPSTVDWVKAHPQFHPGPMSMVDEPNPDTCPIVSTCYTGMQSLVNYAGQQVPNLGTMITLSAYAAFSPSQRWQTYAQPYYSIVSEMGSDFFPYCWANQDFNINAMLINNTRQYGGLKPITFYQDGGMLGGQCHDGNGNPVSPPYPIPASYIENSFWASSNAGAAAVVLFCGTNKVVFGDSQWRILCEAADEITGPPSDINFDGVIDPQDYVIALGAYNPALAGRIAVAAKLKSFFLPFVVKS